MRDFFPNLGLLKSKYYFLIIYNPIYGYFEKFAGRALSGKLGQHPVLTRKGNLFEKKSTKNLKNQCMKLLWFFTIFWLSFCNDTLVFNKFIPDFIHFFLLYSYFVRTS